MLFHVQVLISIVRGLLIGIARGKKQDPLKWLWSAPTECGETRWFTKRLRWYSHNGCLRILEVGDKQFQEH